MIQKLKDVVVVTESYSPKNLAQEGYMGKVLDIENCKNGLMYLIDSHHNRCNPSWCKKVRLATESEIKMYNEGVSILNNL